jgi:hypothetical protein
MLPAGVWVIGSHALMVAPVTAARLNDGKPSEMNGGKPPQTGHGLHMGTWLGSIWHPARAMK